MSECKCSMRTKMVGDGCEVCNPQYVIEILRQQAKEDADEVDRLRAELSEAKAQRVPGVVCVGRARYSHTGGNAGLSWYVADADLGDDSYRHGQPKDGELLFVLAAAREGKPLNPNDCQCNPSSAVGPSCKECPR